MPELDYLDHGRVILPTNADPAIVQVEGYERLYLGLDLGRRDPTVPNALTKRLVNHAPPNDFTEGYAADWTIGQLRDPAQRIADRIEALMMNDHAPATETS